MSGELNMNTSKDIFKLDKDILAFKINPTSFQEAQKLDHPTQISENNFNLQNSTDKNIAIRIKTTKKQFYTVNPSYFIVQPNSTKNINIIYFSVPGESYNSSGHKFKIEGFVIEDTEVNEEVKNLFMKYIKNKKEVMGSALKRYVQFVEDSEYSLPRNLPEIESKISKLSEIEQSSEQQQQQQQQQLRGKKYQEDDSDAAEFRNQEKLNELKKEYNKLKNQIDSLNVSQKNLKDRIQYEKNNQNNNVNVSNLFKYTVPAEKEKNIPNIYYIIAFVISSFVGFYLTK